MSDYLPQEVITNILLRLPIKSLVICTSVCKSWGSMITNSSFIQAHLSHRINFNNLHGTHLLLLHGVSCQNYGNNFFHHAHIHNLKKEVYSLHYDSHVFDEYCKIGFQSPVADRKMSNECFRVVGICNGLVFLADDLSRLGYNFMIWNPSIRKSVILPKPGLRYETFGGYNACHGFAFDAIIKDYKVVRIVEEEPRDQTFVEVYSLAAGSWSDSRLVDPQCGINIGSPQAFVNGALHWDAHRFRSSSYRYFILAFDVSSELFREMMLPKSLDPNLASFLSLQLSVSGDGKSLAMFVRDSTRSSFLDIWVMKEYSVQESWTKLYSIYPQDPADSLLRPLCFRKSGEVVLEIYRRRYGEIKTGIELFSLDLVSGQLEPLGISRYHYHTMDPYHESIVLLDRNDAIFC
uniref:F-box/kelch-repeat protein At3g23880-like isoform X1 n=1 Tax=Fragaria vesca subsp. vesca TaxID=101020 RepID=UPI0005C93CC7|nr:PREDICTED: F-box/kelch-repeat protein At3g23880-like isoform X1 [Fragaria vesca subsp. vesca]XP_011461581.1 PREDICTED: F-box/kelch-repeat protein At3g23880-like isoform X1 [Fragaria vesca subsp. vesca]